MNKRIQELNAELPVHWNEVSALWYEIRIEIPKKEEQEAELCQANAALVLGRMLFRMEERLEYALSELETEEGGGVPAGAWMLVGINQEDEPLLLSLAAELERQLREECGGDQILVGIQRTGPQALPAIHPVDLSKIVFYLVQMPDGMQKTGSCRKGQEKSFCCLHGFGLYPDGLHCRIRVRSDVESAGELIADRICYLTEFLGGSLEQF